MTADAARARDNARGAALMMASMLGFVGNDALMKLTFESLPLFQAMFLRGLFAVAFIGALAAAKGVLWPLVAPQDRPVFALRTAAEVGATCCFLTALFNMPIANATAILQSLPLTVTIGAALLFREPVGWRRWTAIAVGFLGVAIMLRPGTEGFDADALWAVAAVGFVTVRDLSTRRLSAGAPSIFVALMTAAAITLTGAVGSLFESWRPVGPGALAALAGAAAFLLVGYLAAVMTMRVGEIGAVAPFRYTILVWALILGWLVFGEIPDATTLLGAGIVVATGLYTLHRERAARRRA
jgi:drug/metabolite transporter (DMT)-like permease